MATQTPQTLREFTDNLMSDLESGTITAHEALIAMGQYAYFRGDLEEEMQKISEAAFLGEEELAGVVREIAQSMASKIEELPNFQSQQPDKPIKEEIVRARATLQEAAVDGFNASLRERRKLYKQKRRTFIHNVVTTFSKRIPSSTEEALTPLIDASLVASAGESSQDRFKKRFTELLLDSVESRQQPLSPSQKEQIKADVSLVLQESRDVVDEVVAEHSRDYAVFSDMITKPDIARPDVYMDVALHASPSEPIHDVVARASRLSYAATALENNARPINGPVQFFTSDNATGSTRTLQQAADTILSIVSEPVRKNIVTKKMSDALRSLTTSSQHLTDRLGEQFVRSSMFGQFTQNLSTQLSQGVAAYQARSVADDLISTIFRSGPFSTPLASGARERVLDYYELARANALSPKNRQFFSPLSSPWIIFDVLGRVTPKGVLDSLGRPFSPGEEPVKKSGMFLPFIGMFGPFGAIGGLISRVFSSTVDRGTSFLFTNPSLSSQYAASRRAASLPTPISEDMPRLVALAVVTTIVLLFIFPSSLNINQISHSAKIVSIFASLKEKVDQAISGETLCTGDCRWPTTGCISQGPLTPTDSHSAGDDKNAIDIAASFGTAVVSIFPGTATVVDSGDGCANLTSSSCNGGYGNFVDLSYNGKVYRFAHLARGTPISKGASITQGQKIGEVDSSGSSTGHHLHFELRPGSGGSINDVLPVKVPGCVGKDEAAGDGSCPTMMGGLANSCVSIK